MLKVKAKIKIILRIFGFLLIFSGIIISIASEVVTFSIFIYFLYLATIIPFFIYIILTKIEAEFLKKKEELYLATSVIVSTFFFILSIYNINQLDITFLFFLSTISNYLYIICWNYSLSIYRKEKLISIINGICFCILTGIFKNKINISKLAMLFYFISIIFLALGFLIIIIIEIIMKKTHLLKWI
ncbi:MAG: hypothetical protein JXA99_17580 [Candidatus Lokiarchaeota archaeon]|nr:hypothetical protein [Candidatus Lokiarchaeota archaeon]